MIQFFHSNQKFSIYLWLHFYPYSKNEFYNDFYTQTNAISLKLIALCNIL